MSSIILRVVYHSTADVQPENVALCDHIRINLDQLLWHQANSFVIVVRIYKFILQISNDVSLFLPFSIAGVLKSRSTIWINSFPPPFSTLTIPFTEEKISPNSSIDVSTSLLIWGPNRPWTKFIFSISKIHTSECCKWGHRGSGFESRHKSFS